MAWKPSQDIDDEPQDESPRAMTRAQILAARDADKARRVEMYQEQIETTGGWNGPGRIHFVQQNAPNLR
jgi:hypothetical protein